MADLTQGITYFPIVFITIAAGAGIRMFLVPSPRPLRMLAELWLLMAAIQLIALYAYEREVVNLWLANAFQFFFHFYLASIFYRLLPYSGIRVSVQIFYGLYIMVFIINSLFLQGMDSLQTLTIVIGGVFIFFLAGAYFWHLLEREDTGKLSLDPFFWLSFGLVVYMAGTLPFYGMLNYLYRHFYDFTNVYFDYVSNSFSIFLSILVLFAFVCRKTYPKLY